MRDVQCNLYSRYYIYWIQQQYISILDYYNNNSPIDLINLLQQEQTTILCSVALYAPEHERKIRLILNLSSFLNKVVYKIVNKNII